MIYIFMLELYISKSNLLTNTYLRTDCDRYLPVIEPIYLCQINSDLYETLNFMHLGGKSGYLGGNLGYFVGNLRYLWGHSG